MSVTPSVSGISDNALVTLSEHSRACIERLRDHKPTNEHIHHHHEPTPKCGAVLVLLYERGGGGLRVLLTTRSKELRSHPGQTALPGGKVDESDAGVVEAAYREANEEVALPLCSPHLHTLCTLDPLVSQHGVFVTPVVAYLEDVSVLEELRAAPREVERIFDHLLEAVLDPELARDQEGLVPHGSEDWSYEPELYYAVDVPWLGSMYRMHGFRSTASPIWGLTADILLATARVAYAREPVFQRLAQGQWSTVAEVQRALEAAATLSRAGPPGSIEPTTTVRA